MDHPEIKAWREAKKSDEKLRDMAYKAAEAWFESLSNEQPQVFVEIALDEHGLAWVMDKRLGARVGFA